MHPLLQRHIRRLFGSTDVVPVELKPLCEMISTSFEQNDIDRAMIERSLDLASQELTEQNQALARELRQHKATAIQLEHSLSIMHTTLNSTGDGIVMVSNDRRIEGHNTKFVELWKLPDEIVRQRDDYLIIQFVANQLAEPERFLQHIEKVFDSDDTLQDEIEFKDGRVFERYTAPRMIGDLKVGRVWGFRDITDRHNTERRLNYLVNHDDLTGLANRTLLQDRLNQSIAHAHRHNEVMGVVFLDLDQFKFVNDSLGHSAGDELLKVVAQRLKTCIRESDTVARSSGDEFVLVLNKLADIGMPAELAAQTSDLVPSPPMVIDSLQRILGAMSQAIVVSGRELHVTCSIGVCLYPFDGTDTETLLKNADAAMYRAKELGRNNFQFYTAELNSMSSARLELQGMLRYALKREEFALYYQPKIDLASGELAGVEALLRWHSPELGLVGPDRFIPILEQTGMITDVGAWVMARAADDHKRWRTMGLLAPRIAVNVSQLQLDQDNFVALVDSILKRHGGKEAGLDFEITESLIMKDIETNISKLMAIRQMGVQIAIDDFGTGYSSLSYLAKLPVNSIKIDRSFIAKLTTSPDDQTIVKTIISLAHSLNLMVIAEGVETEAQAKLLKQLHCDKIQGYLISAALPEEKFLQWYENYSPLHFGASEHFGFTPPLLSAAG